MEKRDSTSSASAGMVMPMRGDLLNARAWILFFGSEAILAGVLWMIGLLSPSILIVFGAALLSALWAWDNRPQWIPKSIRQFTWLHTMLGTSPPPNAVRKVSSGIVASGSVVLAKKASSLTSTQRTYGRGDTERLSEELFFLRNMLEDLDAEILRPLQLFVAEWRTQLKNPGVAETNEKLETMKNRLRGMVKDFAAYEKSSYYGDEIKEIRKVSGSDYYSIEHLLGALADCQKNIYLIQRRKLDDAEVVNSMFHPRATALATRVSQAKRAVDAMRDAIVLRRDALQKGLAGG